MGKPGKQAGSDYELSRSSVRSESYENSLCLKKEKKLKVKQKKNRVHKKKMHGSWTRQEQSLFAQYIQMHLSVFEEKEMRRKRKIFREMAKFIKTRSSEQCRSHHQKYQIRFPCHNSMLAYINHKVLYGEQPNKPAKETQVPIHKQIISSGQGYKIFRKNGKGFQIQILFDQNFLQ